MSAAALKRNLPRIVRIIAAGVMFAIYAVGFGLGTDVFFHTLYRLQFGPALLRLVAGCSLGALAVIAITCVLTLVFGRFYCAFFCPLGVLQDILGRLLPGTPKPEKDCRKLRIFIAAVSFGLLASGVALGFALLDPFTHFGRIAAATVAPASVHVQENFFVNYYVGIKPVDTAGRVFGLLVLALLIALVAWKKRIFCTAICPVGTLLGLCAGRSVFKLRIAEKCVKCGRCEAVCPAGCIDIATRRIDNERCVRCMNCVAACRPRQIKFSNSARVAESGHCHAPPSRTDTQRRAFLAGAAGTALFAAFAGRLFGPAGRRGIAKNTQSVCPPGAGTQTRFASKCTACMLCAANCPGGVICPPDHKHATVHLKFDRGMCEYSCTRCNQFCPTGALTPLALADKQRRRIGLAELDLALCVTEQDKTDCGACAEHCPTGALRMVENADGKRLPELTAELCIGCGNCEHPCPVQPVKAIIVRPVATQVEAADPVEFFKNKQPETPDVDFGGDWLI